MTRNDMCEAVLALLEKQVIEDSCTYINPYFIQALVTTLEEFYDGGVPDLVYEYLESMWSY